MVSFLYKEMDRFHPFALNYNGMYDPKHINICVPASILSQGIELCPELNLKNTPFSQLHSYCFLTERIFPNTLGRRKFAIHDFYNPAHEEISS